MKTRLVILAASILCPALAGCGSVTGGIDFKAPPGWTSTPSLFGRMQMWIKKTQDSKRDEIVMLVRGTNGTTMNFKQIPTGTSNLRDLKQSTITICGNQRAQYITGVGTNSSEHGNESLEMVSAPSGGDHYLAMYMRPQSQRADPDAEAAIRSLCAKV